MSLCVNCKRRKKNAVVKVGRECAVTHVQDLCKYAAEAADVLDNVTGKRYLPSESVDSVKCININTTGVCGNYDEKSGGLTEPETEIEIGGD
ncbi:MAG: hypothetical protein PHX83_06685 [Acidobacteriia bacterium]|nr:hypothetical protein [Terriglobia bacterium]